MKNNKIMTHIVAGFPNLKKSGEVALIMANSAVDFIEIQIPFSDPVADGPTIMAANQKALDSGTKVEDCFDLMADLYRKFKKNSVAPKLLFMSYLNILHHYGIGKFCKKAHECGCYGLIVPDMPIDEEKWEKYLKNCSKYGLKAIQVISPLTPVDRLKKIAKVANGFVYCVSRYGTTGQTKSLNSDLHNYLKKVKKYIKLPLAVGFGISEREHVEQVWEGAEIAVIGSKIISLIGSNKNYLQKIKEFLKHIRKEAWVKF